MSAIKRPSKVKANRNFRLKPIVLAVAYCFALNAAQANPIGAQVVNGTAVISQSGNTLNITNSPNAIINWQGFSINSGETTRFIQQSASSAVLNRVLGADPSVLLGALTSNGRVFLVNPAGILVGQGARIDVAGLVASTLNISNSDFLAGKLNFTSPLPQAGEGLGERASSIINQGAITTPDGGTVYLIAPQIENQGIITTPKGETLLAAGNSVQLMDTGTPGVTVQVTGSGNSATNLGQILADSGRIGMVGATLKNSGTLSASSLVSEGGRVFLRASQDAYVDKDGSITATGSKGGSIEVLGNRVAVMDNAQLDASGQNGGGSVLVGGDAHGANPDIQNANITYFGPQASIKADGTTNGDGGKVIVWADDTTRAFGSISARGGNNGGNGGFVETSGKSGLLVDGIGVTTAAPMGRTGMWLLDPIAINIVANGTGSLPITGIFDPSAAPTDISPADITTGPYGLNYNNVTIQTAAGGGGTITVTDPVSWGTGNQLILQAGNGIAINGAITGSGPLVLSTITGDITQTAAIIVPSLAVSASAGAVTLNNPSNSVGVLAGNAGGGTGFSFTNAGNLQIGAVASVNGISTPGMIALVSGGALTQSAGALLGSTSAYFEGSQVILTNANPVGVIAGKATGGAFDYTSSNGIQVTTVNSNAGIQTSNSSVILNAGSSGIGVVAPINAGFGGVSMNTAGNSNINSAITGSTIDLQSLSGIILGPAATLTASGVATIILNAGTGGFFNGASAAVLSAPSSRWLVYAASPASVVKGGLTSAFRHYNATYANYAFPIEAGNGFIYASTPGALSVNTTLASGTASNTYGTAPTAVFGYTIAGIFDKEDISGTAIFTPVISSTTPANSYNVVYAGGLTSAASSSGGSAAPVSVSYTITPGVGLAYTVNPATLTITASLTGTASKTYDGNTNAILAPGNFLLSGFAPNESASVTKTTGTYASPNVGSGILVSTTLAPTDFSPVGSTNLSNYILPTSASGFVGSITPLAATLILAGNKVYDGTPTFSTGQLGISNVVSGDVLSLSAGSADTADKNVGVNKPFVSFSGLTLTGASAGNYTLTGVSGTGTITARPVTFTVDPGQGKTYGQFDPVRVSFNDNAGAMQVVAGDSLFGILTRAAGENAGAYPVAQGSLTSANNPNYDITFVGDAFTINPAPLEIIANHQTKTFGAPDPAQSFILNGLMQNAALGIDDVAAATSGTLMSGALTREAGEAVGGGSTNGEYAYVLGSLSAGANYTINAFTSNTLAIKPELGTTLNPLITIPLPKDIVTTGATGGGAPPPPPPPAPELTAGGTVGSFGDVAENGSDKENGGNGKDDNAPKKKGQKDNEGNGNGKDDEGKKDEKPGKC